MLITELTVAVELGAHLDGLSVPWVIGGSVASSLQSVPRSTADIDLVADLRLVHAAPLLVALGDAYYVVAEVVRWAIQERRSFNVMHLASMTKVDIFCCPEDPLSRAQLERRQMIEYAGGKLPILTAEDIILQKLRWYVDGGEVSDRQWQDALGVARFHRGALDRVYLERQAAGAGLGTLLARLLAVPAQGDGAGG